MVSRMHLWHEIATFFLSICVVLVLILLVVVPAHSQYLLTPNERVVEVVKESDMTMSPGVFACLVLQFLFLVGMMLSYLQISNRIESPKTFWQHHWVHGRLRWHH